jgi:hypothetical protein
MDLPDTYKVDNNYLQESDSDDDDRPDRPSKAVTRNGTAAKGGAGAKKGGNGKGAAVTFKHDKPIVRERPLSAKAFHQIAAHDPELKVILHRLCFLVWESLTNFVLWTIIVFHPGDVSTQ